MPSLFTDQSPILTSEDWGDHVRVTTLNGGRVIRRFHGVSRQKDAAAFVSAFMEGYWFHKELCYEEDH
jgi:hypothetical protein